MRTNHCARLLLMAGFSLANITPALAGEVAITSGQYEALKLAVTPDHHVEGYYFEEMGEGVTRSCVFYLQGAIDGAGSAQVMTWDRDAYPGSLAASEHGVTLAVERGSEHPGCLGILGPEVVTGIELSRIASKQWIGLVRVSVDKAYLQKNPGDNTAGRAYIIKDDVVGVLAKKDGWAKVEFINSNNHSFTGWISQDQYGQLSPPQH